MPIGNGRGDAKKDGLRREWELVPVMHTRLLNGHTITCCCGDEVTTNYYRFDARHRVSGMRDVLYAHADGCARKLMEIAPAIASIPLFNPLQAVAEARLQRGGGGVDGGGRGMDPFNAELYAAIHLTLMCWERPPTSGGPLVNILDKIRSAPDQPLMRGAAKSVNTVIASGQRTLTTMLQALPAQNPPLRTFEFLLMRQALEDHPEQPPIWL